MFGFLQAMSPWWWVAFAVALGALEMATMSFFLIWPALAALVLALVHWLMPGLGGEVQVVLFAALAVAMTFAGRGLLNRYGDGEAEHDLNARGRQLIGRHANVEAFTGPEGIVIIDGIRWQAKWADASRSEPGTSVEVTGAEGMTLIVRPPV
ncbi:MAG: NfeD family protein [Rhodobacteraceae bacterium]|nr:NfeD family protein [Paracoccaceae bacterium]